MKHRVQPLAGNVLLHYLLQLAVTGDTFNQLPYNYAKVFTKWQIPIGWARALPALPVEANIFVHSPAHWLQQALSSEIMQVSIYCLFLYCLNFYYIEI